MATVDGLNGLPYLFMTVEIVPRKIQTLPGPPFYS